MQITRSLYLSSKAIKYDDIICSICRNSPSVQLLARLNWKMNVMPKAQVIHKLGPPSAVQWQDWHVPDPAPGEVRFRHTEVGVNFASLDGPSTVVIGFEGVDIVEGVGDGASNFKSGDRVAYGIPPLGSYSETRNYPADKLLHMPKNFDDKTAAALLMKGMTAHYLLHRTYAVQPWRHCTVSCSGGWYGFNFMPMGQLTQNCATSALASKVASKDGSAP